MIYIILLFSLVLRLVALNQSFWMDEAIGVIAIHDFSYKDLVFEFLKFDNHPPIYYLTLKIWSEIFGYSEVALRMLSVVVGVATVYLTFTIAKVLSKNNFFALVSAILLTTSQFHIYYSQEVRMYPMITLLSCISILLFTKLVEKSSVSFWVLFSLTLVSLVFTDYITVFLLPVFWVWALVNRKDFGWWVRFIASHLPLFLLGLMWLPMLLIQAESGRWLLTTLPAWREVAGGATFKQAVLIWTKYAVGRISFLTKPIYYSYVIVSSIPFATALFFSLKKQTKEVGLVVIWLVIPLVLGFIASLSFPAFIYFRFMYVVPAFYMLISWVLTNIKYRKLKLTIFASILIVNLTSYLIYIMDKNQQREDWKGAVSFVEESAQDGEISLFEYKEPFAPYRWYSNGSVVEIGATDSISADPVLTRDKTRMAIEDTPGIYYFEYLRDLSDPQRVVEGVLESEGFEITNIRSFPGVGHVYHWTKKTNIE